MKSFLPLSPLHTSPRNYDLTILGKWTTWRIILFYVFIFIFNSLHVSCSSSGETNCVNTNSGSCRWLCRVQVQVNFRPTNDTATDTEWQLPDVVLTQFVSPDDEHDVLEICRELKIKKKHIEKNCALRWSFTKNHYMMQVNNIHIYIYICMYIKMGVDSATLLREVVQNMFFLPQYMLIWN